MLVRRIGTLVEAPMSFRARSESAQQNDQHFQGPSSGSVRVHFGSIERQQPIFWLNRSLAELADLLLERE